MKRKNAVFDTNILIDLLKGKLDKAAFTSRFRNCRWIISEMTEIELFSFSGLTAENEAEIRKFLRRFRIVRLNRAIKAETIRLRKALRRKLPDSIIAATAVRLKAALVSNDSHLTKAVYPGLAVKTFP